MHHKWPRGCGKIKKIQGVQAEQCIHTAQRGGGNTKKWNRSFIPLNPFCFYNHYTTCRALRCITPKHPCHIPGIFKAFHFLSPYLFPRCSVFDSSSFSNLIPVCLNPAAAKMRCLQRVKHISTFLFCRSFPFISTQSISSSSNKQLFTFSIQVEPTL